MSLAEYHGDPFDYLSKLDGKLAALDAQKVLTAIRPGLAALYISDRATFALAAEMSEKKLGVGRRDLEAAIKPLIEEDKSPSQATRLVTLAESMTLFHTAEGEAWATLTVGEHQEHWPLHMKGFRRWLARQFYAEERKVPGSQQLQDAIGVLEGKAIYEGEEQSIFVRNAEYNGKLYLDLANADWQAVEITRHAWSVVNRPSVRFDARSPCCRCRYQQEADKLTIFWPFVNVREEDRKLLVGWLLMCFSPDGPYPVLGLSGGPGSTKSTTARVLRSLTDPFLAPLRRPPREERDLMISARASRVLAFDNLSHLPRWLSDAFCTLATGSEFSTRELYSNDDETIFNEKRPVLFTAIEDIAVEADLIDRGIRLMLSPLDEAERKGEVTFWTAFEKARPSILGALLDVLVVILRRRASIKLKRLPRMADFAVWVAAGAPALNWKVNDFLSAYEENRFTANELTLEASTVARGILLLAKAGDWEGTAGDLLEKLVTLLTERETKARSWPKNPLALSNALRRLAPSLGTAGVTVEFYRVGGKDSRRTISIRMGTQKSVTSVTNEEESEEELNFAQDSRDDCGDAPVTLGDAPKARASPEKSNKIKIGDARHAGDAPKHPYSKPVVLADEEEEWQA